MHRLAVLVLTRCSQGNVQAQGPTQSVSPLSYIHFILILLRRYVTGLEDRLEKMEDLLKRVRIFVASHAQFTRAMTSRSTFLTLLTCSCGLNPIFQKS